MKKHDKQVHLKGDYKLWIVKALMNRRLGKLAIEFRVVGPDRRVIGAQLRYMFSLEQWADIQKLRELLEACGVNVPNKPVKVNLGPFSRLECIGRVENGELVSFCSVAEFYEQLRERDRRFERAVKHRCSRRSERDCFVIPILDEPRSEDSRKFVM